MHPGVTKDQECKAMACEIWLKRMMRLEWLLVVTNSMVIAKATHPDNTSDVLVPTTHYGGPTFWSDAATMSVVHCSSGQSSREV